MDKQIVFVDKNRAELLDAEVSTLKPEQVKVRTVVSTISNGTEYANIVGNPVVNLNAKATDKAQFPRYSGYSTSGVVVEKGENVKGIEVGDRVAMYWTTHRKYNVINEKNAVKIESDKVSYNEAALAHIGAFSLAAIRKTKLEIGESAMVMGMGILGLMAVQFAHAAGAVPVIAVDPIAERREKALKFGADYVFDPFDEDFAEKVKAVTGSGVNVAIEVTGKGEGLNETLDCMAKFGRVALLGCTRESDFTVDYYRKVHGPGVSLVGAHTLARPEHDSSHGYFTTADDIKAILKLCENGRINLKDMVEEIHSPTECTQVYERLVKGKDFPTVVQFDWDLL